jgi:hypothetical protein
LAVKGPIGGSGTGQNAKETLVAEDVAVTSLQDHFVTENHNKVSDVKITSL